MPAKRILAKEPLSSQAKPELAVESQSHSHRTIDYTAITLDTINSYPINVQIEWYRRINAGLKTKSGSALSMKVSEKGALSVYGIGRFPVTLYAGQWEKLLEKSNEISQFIKDNNDTLSRK